MARSKDDAQSDLDADPIYDLDRAEVFLRLFGGTRIEAHWRPVRRRFDRTEIERRSPSAEPVAVAIDMLALHSLETPAPVPSRVEDGIGIWTPPVGENRLPIDRKIDELIADKIIVDVDPAIDRKLDKMIADGKIVDMDLDRAKGVRATVGSYMPHHRVRLYIADAAEIATRRLRDHTAILSLRAFADAVQTVAKTVGDPQAAEHAARIFAIDFDTPPPRDFRAVGTRDQDAREQALAADLGAVMTALRPAQPMLERIAARTGTVTGLAHPKGRHPDVWKHAFAAEMTRAWRGLVQDAYKRPSLNEDSKYQNFILAAYQSLGGTRSRRFLGAVQRLSASGSLEPEPLSTT